jgi:hypothetical protein
MRTVIALTVVLACAADASAGHHCYVYPAQIVAPVYQQAVYYDVGSAIREKAIAIKAVEEATPRIIAEVTQQLQALHAAGQQNGGLALKAPALLAAKCARCHNAQSQETDLVFDGRPITIGQYKRFDSIFGLHQDIPDKMKSLVAGMKPEDIGALKQEMIGLEIVGTAQPQTAPPAPELPPEQPDPPPLTPGDRRWDKQSKGWIEYGEDGKWYAVPKPAPPAEPANGGPKETPKPPEPGGLMKSEQKKANEAEFYRIESERNAALEKLYP